MPLDVLPVLPEDLLRRLEALDGLPRRYRALFPAGVQPAEGTAAQHFLGELGGLQVVGDLRARRDGGLRHLLALPEGLPPGPPAPSAAFPRPPASRGLRRGTPRSRAGPQGSWKSIPREGSRKVPASRIRTACVRNSSASPVPLPDPRREGQGAPVIFQPRAVLEEPGRAHCREPGGTAGLRRGGLYPSLDLRRAGAFRELQRGTPCSRTGSPRPSPARRTSRQGSPAPSPRSATPDTGTGSIPSRRGKRPSSRSRNPSPPAASGSTGAPLWFLKYARKAMRGPIEVSFCAALKARSATSAAIFGSGFVSMILMHSATESAFRICSIFAFSICSPRLFRVVALRIALDVALIGRRRVGAFRHVPGGDVRGGRAPGESESENRQICFSHAC